MKHNSKINSIETRGPTEGLALRSGGEYARRTSKSVVEGEKIGNKQGNPLERSETTTAERNLRDNTNYTRNGAR